MTEMKTREAKLKKMHEADMTEMKELKKMHQTDMKEMRSFFYGDSTHYDSLFEPCSRVAFCYEMINLLKNM